MLKFKIEMATVKADKWLKSVWLLPFSVHRPHPGIRVFLAVWRVSIMFSVPHSGCLPSRRKLCISVHIQCTLYHFSPHQWSHSRKRLQHLPLDKQLWEREWTPADPGTTGTWTHNILPTSGLIKQGPIPN